MVEECSKQYFLYVGIKSIEVPFPLKHVSEFNMLDRFKDGIKDINLGLFGSILKSVVVINASTFIDKFLRNIVFAQEAYKYT